jgi:hypothetical protein
VVLHRAWLRAQSCLHCPPRPPHFEVTQRWYSPRQVLSQSTFDFVSVVAGPVGSGGGAVPMGGGAVPTGAGDGWPVVEIGWVPGDATGGSGGGHADSGGTHGTYWAPSHWRRSDAVGLPNSQITPLSSAVHAGGPARAGVANVAAQTTRSERSVRDMRAS